MSIVVLTFRQASELHQATIHNRETLLDYGISQLSYALQGTGIKST
jgi:hypothetical protein